ncbi:hypothetical protein ACRAWD_21630 [Caulobacter segnis]
MASAACSTRPRLALDPRDTPDAGAGGDAWRVVRDRNKWRSLEETTRHPIPGTHPVVITDPQDWGGWRVPRGGVRPRPGANRGPGADHRRRAQAARPGPGADHPGRRRRRARGAARAGATRGGHRTGLRPA